MKIVKFSIIITLFLFTCNCKNEKRGSTKIISQAEKSLVESKDKKLGETQTEDTLSLKEVAKNYERSKEADEVLVTQRGKELFLYKYDVIGNDKLSNAEDSFAVDFKQQKLIEHQNSTDDYSETFLFQDLKVTLKYLFEKGTNLFIDETEYKIHEIFDMGDLSVSNYRHAEENVFIIHLEDYYSSLYFVYFFSSKKLYYAGHLSVDEPKVEEIGIKKKSFTVKKGNGKIIVDSFIDGELFGTVNFDKFKNIPKAGNNDM